jgi:hypothetical protein
MTRRGGGDGVRAPLKFIFAAERKWRGSVFAGRDCESAEKIALFAGPLPFQRTWNISKSLAASATCVLKSASKRFPKLSIMVKQHIFNINSQSLLVEIIFIKRGNLLASRYLCA